MSSYYRTTKNPKSGKFEPAAWLDNYYGPHQYAVKFPDGSIYREDPGVIQWEFGDAPTGQPNKEGSDKNVGNPDTTLDKIVLEVYFTTSVTGKDIAIAKAKAAIEAYTAKAVQEELERLKAISETSRDEHVIRDAIDARIEQLKQEEAK